MGEALRRRDGRGRPRLCSSSLAPRERLGAAALGGRAGAPPKPGRAAQTVPLRGRLPSKEGRVGRGQRARARPPKAGLPPRDGAEEGLRQGGRRGARPSGESGRTRSARGLRLAEPL